MKQLITLIILLSASFFSNAYTLQYIGTIEAKKYNDVWESYFDADIDLYAGSDGDWSNIRLVFDMSLDTYNYDIVFSGMNPSIDPEFETLHAHLLKAKDWTKIARDNNANTNKDIGSCNVSGTKCKVSFVSSNGGKNIVTKIYIKEDATFTLNDDTFRLNPRQLDQLLRWLDAVNMTAVLKRSAKENNQSDDLFN
jgi:hypothetical protein|tara:strand:- start:215 stop:799 length:585 start_codon:yes stop_codon:yes gene_type:complete